MGGNPGRKAHPLFRFLTDRRTNPRFAGRDGTLLARFRSQEEPESEPVRRAVEEALGG